MALLDVGQDANALENNNNKDTVDEVIKYNNSTGSGEIFIFYVGFKVELISWDNPNFDSMSSKYTIMNIGSRK